MSIILLQKVKPPLALANSVGVEFGAKTKTTHTGQTSTSTAKDFTDDDLQQDNNLRTSTSKVIPFGQKTKIISSTSTPIANPDKSTSPRTTTVLYKISNSTTPKGSTAKLRFGQKFPKTTPSFQSTLLDSNKGMDDKLSTTTTPVTTTQPDEATTKSPSTHSTTSTKKRVTKSTTVTSTPLNTSRRRSTTQVC